MTNVENAMNEFKQKGFIDKIKGAYYIFLVLKAMPADLKV